MPIGNILKYDINFPTELNIQFTSNLNIFNIMNSIQLLKLIHFIHKR